MRIISDLFRTFAPRLLRCSGIVNLTAFANVHPQYSYWKLKRRASVLQVESGKFKIRTRRSTTVHVYTWACRLMVFSKGYSRALLGDVGYTGSRFVFIPNSSALCR